MHKISKYLMYVVFNVKGKWPYMQASSGICVQNGLGNCAIVFCLMIKI